MRRLMRELKELRTEPPEGIRVQLSEESILDVVGIIEGPEGTPYQGGYFRVKFEFTEEFPATPPRCWFATKIFHPNVSSSGEICVNTLKKDWKSSYGIGHILVTVKCLLIYPNPDSALDEEAGKLLQENYESYCERAKLITSVHATPKVPPPEFTTQSVLANIPDAPAPIVASLPSTSSLSSLSPSSLLLSQKGVITAATATIPLQQSASNTFSLSSSLSSLINTASEKEKDRHASPAPLGTADSNVAPVINPGSAGAILSPAKAVKRGAAPGVAAGEKRKKALKRL
ncbi:ubiquitin-conjugating enzyme/RWD-like protein [Multifurca ochricompacta]|uniref:E2 ubiquitin-conjugating enzyme n=1 Tax=Multifurca ochricompacta TaxID=376703 RepID=A0AAD4QK30_9AGAM|nr:ubiquitin-conjugating enzyme/RWD-like protein [Multifurca ochricompacta]